MGLIVMPRVLRLGLWILYGTRRILQGSWNMYIYIYIGSIGFSSYKGLLRVILYLGLPLIAMQKL